MYSKFIFSAYLLWLLLAYNKAFATTSYTIVKGTINGVQTDRVVLYEYGTRGQKVLEQANIIDKNFEINTTTTFKKGIYTLQFSPNDFIEIMIKDSTIPLIIEINKMGNIVDVKFLNSEVNSYWQNFKNTRKHVENRMQSLYNFIASYSDNNSKIVKSAFNTFEKELTVLHEKRKKFLSDTKDVLLYKYENNRPVRFPDPKLSNTINEIEKRKIFWNGINTTDTDLINTPLYNGLIYEYISYYLGNNLIDNERSEIALKKSIDTVMYYFNENEATYRFALNYITDGFKQLGMDNILQYIDTHYNSVEKCENDKEKNDLQKRLMSYELLKEGSIAPTILYGDNKTLHDIAADTIILAFWASWCPHCMKEMPLLNNIIGNNESIKCLAISLDNETSTYFETIKNLNNLLHYCDFASWESQPAKDYFIYATPIFLALNKERRILRKFNDVNEISEWIK